MSVFSGVIPIVKVTGNSALNSVATNLIQNSITSAVGIALGQSTSPSPIIGFANTLIGPPGDTLLQSIVTPGITTQGAVGLNQIITNNIVNSKALGPFGPLVGNLLQEGVNFLAGTAINSVFGGSGRGGLFFPGAGGEGEEEANYQGSTYSLGLGGPDVVFSIAPATTPAAFEAMSFFTPAAPGQTESWSGGFDDAIGFFQDPDLKFQEALTKSEFFQNLPPLGELAFTNANLGGFGIDIADPFSFQKRGWKFICPPQEISWETTAEVNRVSIFGANNAPVLMGSKGMRELSLGGAIVEGFTRSKAIEEKVILLEKLMDMKISSDSRYLQIPVYRVKANSKIYGNGLEEGGYFVIKSIQVNEALRDFSGKATRAIVNISLTQVPKYQVEDGRDIASKSLSSTKGAIDKIAASVERQAAQAISKGAK